MQVLQPIVPQPIADLYANSFFSNTAPIKFNKIIDHRISNTHWHCHPQIWYTVRGSYYHTIGNKRVLQTAGSVAIDAPFSVHSIDSSETDLENTEVISVLFPIDVFEQALMPFFSISSNCVAFENFLLTPFMKLHGKDKYLADELFADMLADVGQQRDLYIKRIFSNLCRFFEICIKNIDNSMSKRDVHLAHERSLYINNSVNFSISNYSSHISIENARNSAIMSRRSFTEKFKTTVGQTYVEFLTNIRMRKAISALRFTDMSISEIADSCGFANSGHFISVCTNIFSMSPTLLRQHFEQWRCSYGEMSDRHNRFTNQLNSWNPDFDVG